ncbi:hypothetical protein [Spirosoma montaniterrae]|uniref:hypothetical protein n=1 Tax=Spirosoma montaniterrae TaxID=1178516 RepID=UPI001E453128|nr:hypothetical protein [Spirosoma montaniterrae]
MQPPGCHGLARHFQQKAYQRSYQTLPSQVVWQVAGPLCGVFVENTRQDGGRQNKKGMTQ